jgi:hypothetical protein
VNLESLVEEFLQLSEGVAAYDVAADLGSRAFTVRGVCVNFFCLFLFIFKIQYE